MDVDGTYTDGLLFYDSEGEVIKGFHAHDGLALELLRLVGIKRGFITGRKDNATKARAEYLRVDFFMNDIRDKDIALKKVLDDFGIDKSECVFMGDDLNDYLAFTAAGIKVAVPNGSIEIINAADYVTKARGGEGAVREVVNLILKAKGIDPVELWVNGKGSVGSKQ